MYILSKSTGFYIGFDGHEPFISVPNTNLSSKTSVRFDGIGLCSCEGGTPCTSNYVPSDWLFCTTGRFIFLDHFRLDPNSSFQFNLYFDDT